jgi:hypothetical protein
MKKVLLVAPVLSRSGYGEMGRFALRALMSKPGIDLYIHNINWGKSGWIWKDNQERKLIDALLQKTVLFSQNNGQFDASVQCTIPNEWKRLSPYDVGYTAGIETDKVAGEWLVKGNDMDKIITISKHGMDVFKNTSYEATDKATGQKIPKYKCDTEMSFVGFPKRSVGCEDLDLTLRHDFNFLCVAQLGPRKNIDAVVNNFIEEFKNDEVGLLLKIHGANDSVMDYHDIRKINLIRYQIQPKKKDGSVRSMYCMEIYQMSKCKACIIILKLKQWYLLHTERALDYLYMKHPVMDYQL